MICPRLRSLVALLATLALSMALPSRAGAQAEEAPAAKPRVAVMGVQLVGFPEGVRELFTEALAQGAARQEDYDVLSQAEITSILGLEAQKQLLGCNDDSCLVELAGALDAAFLVTGKVVKLGSVTNLSVSMIDLAQTSVVSREHMEVDDDGQVVRWLRYLGAKIVGVDPGEDLAKDVGIVTGPRWRASAGLGLAGLGTHGMVVLPSIPFVTNDPNRDPRSEPVVPTLHEGQWNSNLGFTIDFGFQVKRWLRIELGYEHRNMESQLEVDPTRLHGAYWDGSDDVGASNGISAGCIAVFAEQTTAEAYNAALGDLAGTGGDTINTALQEGGAGLLRERSAATWGKCYSNTKVQTLMVGLPFVLFPTRFVAFEIGPRVGFGALTLVGWQAGESGGSPGSAALFLGGRLGLAFLFKEAFAAFPLDLTLDLKGDVYYLRGITTDEQVHARTVTEDASGEIQASDLEAKRVRVEMPYPTITLALGMRF
ncbi:MAG: hypothetical protein P1V51_18905 [Deltaproteobacteria bacterium]|nr:hypothetical protein [Deltaproteobacteria bacterium]